MVAEYGMSEELGYISLRDSSNPENSYGFNRKYSPDTSNRIDDAVQTIIKNNYERTYALLTEHRDKLELLAKTLLDKEVMNHQDLRDLLGDRPKGKHADGLFSEAKIVDEVVSDESTSETDESTTSDESTSESDESTTETKKNASKNHSEASDEDVKNGQSIRKEEGKEQKKDLFS
jgi:cell division protease FtsH